MISRENTNLPEESDVPIRIVTPVGMLGYGFSAEQVDKCLASLSTTELKATALIADAGSTDSGPSKLAFGETTCPYEAYKSDFQKMLDFVHRYNVPILCSSAGGDGSNAHVDMFSQVIAEIEQERESQAEGKPVRKLKVLKIYSEVKKSFVTDKLDSGLVTGCGTIVPALTKHDIEACPTIVAQMGPEPFLDAMLAHPDFDIVIGGRAYDPAPYIAYTLFKLHPDPASVLIPTLTAAEKYASFLGSIYHMGKIMECGALCATPKSLSAMATIYSNGEFDVVPLDPRARCTSLSVAAHTFYEKSRPDLLYGPGGYIDLTNSKYTELSDGKSVRVSGATFSYSRHKENFYTIKLEGAKAEGYRTIFMGGIRDPILISELDGYLERAQKYAAAQHPKPSEDEWQLEFHVYGRDGVMGPLEPNRNQPIASHEVFLVAECLAATQKKASQVASSARVAICHGAYPGQLATGGSFGFGLGGKNMIETGPCANFAIYHLIELEEGQERGHNSDDPDAKDNALFPYTIDKNFRTENDESRTTTPRAIHSKATPPYLDPVTSPPDTPSAPNPTRPTHLKDIARIIRSKNSGPFEITLDILFDSPLTYNLIKSSNLLTPTLIQSIYNLPSTADVLCCMFFDQALGFKATIPRRGANGQCRASGGFGETDVQGSQLYAGLLELEIDEELGGRIQQALAAVV